MDEVEIIRVEDGLLLRPTSKDLGRALDLFASFSPDFMEERRQPALQLREDL